MSPDSWLARELGGKSIKLKIEIPMPLNLVRLFGGHLLRCLATVVSLLCIMTKGCDWNLVSIFFFI